MAPSCTISNRCSCWNKCDCDRYDSIGSGGGAVVTPKSPIKEMVDSEKFRRKCLYSEYWIGCSLFNCHSKDLCLLNSQYNNRKGVKRILNRIERRF